jgi:N-(2-amino-2-carboxyethyl)-L-glutamate synthase
MVAESIDKLIGDTPLVRLSTISNADRGINVYGKLESFNPGNSVKDRSARRLIEQAQRDHKLTAGSVIVESTSGNMGHALAMLCAVHKYRFICVLDPKTPRSNVTLVKAFGGEVEMVNTPDETGSFQKKRIAVAKAIAGSLPNCVNLDQYSNPAAIDAHYYATGPEIYRQLDGRVDVLIGSASTGSHLSGIAKYLKGRASSVHIIGVEPIGSVVFGGEYKPHLQNGSGLSFKPGNILTSLIDEVIKVSDRDAFAACRSIARSEGLLLGGSSGSVIHAGKEHIRQVRSPCNIVVVLPDGGLKYLDTIYDDQWLENQDLGELAYDALERRPAVQQVVQEEPAELLVA